MYILQRDNDTFLKIQASYSKFITPIKTYYDDEKKNIQKHKHPN